MKHISLEPWQSHPLSFANTSIRLFEYDGMLLRGISATYEPQVRELFKKGVLDALIARDLLVQTEISDYSSDEYPLVLKHERISTITYPAEWAPEALRAVGMAVLDLQEVLLNHGYILGDISPWNILFRRTEPVFVDFGSLVWGAAATIEQFVNEFHRYYIWPLQLAKKGLWRYVIYLVGDFNHAVQYDDALLLLGPRELARSATFPGRARIWPGEFLRRTLPESVNKYLRRLGIGVKAPAAKPSATDLRVRIDDLRASLSGVKLPKSDRWAKYYEESQTFDRLNDWNQKQLSVKQVLGEVSPRSLFDVCPSGGWYSLLAGSMGIRVVSSDVVPEMMNQLYLTARNGDRDIYPIVMDFCDPSPARGVANNWFKPATERFRSEMVMCLAAVPTLVFGSQLSFDQIVAGLAAFSEKWLLVEFIPREDEIAGKYWEARQHHWYTQANFVHALEHHFRIRRTYLSFPATRKLFLCERNEAA